MKYCSLHLFNEFTAPTEEQINAMVKRNQCDICRHIEEEHAEAEYYRRHDV